MRKPNPPQIYRAEPAADSRGELFAAGWVFELSVIRKECGPKPAWEANRRAKETERGARAECGPPRSPLGSFALRFEPLVGKPEENPITIGSAVQLFVFQIIDVSPCDASARRILIIEAPAGETRRGSGTNERHVAIGRFDYRQ